ncbi:DUF4224 domain-containing protein [Achromobacter animicus]|uniref:DUF4224 domain-containing protein n=1 Tax=Achromobacter animicus TaxID=1389935 RepID=UPI0014673B44|nr:DUF4224 domain-containing protein [Achromobacter animicus]CAB3901274.1 hypothetical protein LMG26691_04503 [Achromobacter animicus]
MLTLTDDEIEQVTRKKRRQAQAKVLTSLGIRFQVRPDGTLLVFRASLGIPHQESRPEPKMHLRNAHPKVRPPPARKRK